MSFDPPVDYGRAALPPPPPRGAWVKWVVIGCVSFVFLIVSVVGGCSWFVLHRAEQSIRAWDALGDQSLRGHPIVEKHLGRVQSVTQLSHRSTSMTRITRYRVVGERDTADAEVEAGFMDFSDQLHPKMRAGWLYVGNKQINLGTGEETPLGPAKRD